MLLGISGAWIGTMTALMPYQPIFATVALVLLGMAFYKTYHRPKTEECAPGTYCAGATAGRLNKIMLWFFTVVIAGLLTFPYAAPFVFAGPPEDGAPTKQVTLEVKGMT
jgi:mercuric ion transport protein